MSTIDSALEASQTTQVSEPVTEGSSTRIAVEGEGNVPHFLYVFERDEHFEIALGSHQFLGDHLFAVPEVEAHGDRWMLIERRSTKTVANLIQEKGGTKLSDLGRRGTTLAAEMGTVLAKLHNVPVDPRFGHPTRKERGFSYLTFSGYVAAQLEEIQEEFRKRGFDESTSRQLATSVSDLRHELASFHPRTPTSWTHGRPGVEHFWVDEESYDIVALTGFEHSRLLPREADIASFLFIDGLIDDESMIRSLYQGYGAARTMDVQRRERFYRRLIALSALSGSLGDLRQNQDALLALLD